MRNMIGAAAIASVVVGGLGYFAFNDRLKYLETIDERRGPNPRQTDIILFIQGGQCVAKFDYERIGNKNNKSVSWWVSNRGCAVEGEWWVELEFEGTPYPFDTAVVRSFGPYQRIHEKIKGDVPYDCYPFKTYLVNAGKRTLLGDPEIEVEPPSRALKGGNRCAP